MTNDDPHFFILIRNNDTGETRRCLNEFEWEPEYIEVFQMGEFNCDCNLHRIYNDYEPDTDMACDGEVYEIVCIEVHSSEIVQEDGTLRVMH